MIKDAIQKFVASLFQRKMLFAFFCQLEKWALLGLAYTNFKIGWEYVAFFIGKDIIILTLLGMVAWEKISVKFEK